ncbi:hypothetical protein ACH4JZ_18445 [Streptomyces sp. NPDC017615]
MPLPTAPGVYLLAAVACAAFGLLTLAGAAVSAYVDHRQDQRTAEEAQQP